MLFERLKCFIPPSGFSIIKSSASHKMYFLLNNEQKPASDGLARLSLGSGRSLEDNVGVINNKSYCCSLCNNADIQTHAVLFPYGWHSPEYCNVIRSAEELILKFGLLTDSRWFCSVVFCRTVSIIADTVCVCGPQWSGLCSRSSSVSGFVRKSLQPISYSGSTLHHAPRFFSSSTSLWFVPSTHKPRKRTAANLIEACKVMN